MEWFWTTSSMYQRVFRRAAELTSRNWWVLITLFAYTLIMTLAMSVAPHLGIAGGFLMMAVQAACASSFLYLVEMMVRTTRVTVDDFRNSFLPYLGDIMGIAFVMWVFWTLVTPALIAMPQGEFVEFAIELVGLVLFNALPELVYLGHYSSLQLFAESFTFIGNNWIEWFPANLVAGAIIYIVASAPMAAPFSYVQLGFVSLLVYFTMVMRGLLFLELHGSSRRGRAFKYRSQG